MELYRSDESGVYFGNGAPSGYSPVPALHIDKVTGALYRNTGGNATWALAANLASGVTGTLPYANGGTNAITQAAARVNLSSGKSYADVTALLAGTPDFAFQYQSALDSAVSFGNPALGVTLKNSHYYTAAPFDISGLLTAGRIAATAPAGGSNHHIFTVDGADGVLFLKQLASPGIAALSLWTVGKDYPQATFGYADAASSAPYAGRCFIGTNPETANPTGVPLDIVLAQEQNSGGGLYRAHIRLIANATAQSISLLGWTDGADLGPTGVMVRAAGTVNMPNLPSADPHVVGDLWRNSGVVTVSAG